MERIVLELDDALAGIWKRLPDAEKQKLSSRAISALLNGELYPTGAEQLELAVDLAEDGLPSNLISKLTRLEPEAFEAFIKK